MLVLFPKKDSSNAWIEQIFKEDTCMCTYQERGTLSLTWLTSQEAAIKGMMKVTLNKTNFTIKVRYLHTHLHHNMTKS